jgi:hypothetical protein
LRRDEEPPLRDELLREPELRELEEPPLREPELREPELRELDEPPELREPELRELELREPEPEPELRELDEPPERDRELPPLRDDEPLLRELELRDDEPPERLRDELELELLRERDAVERRRVLDERRSAAGISSCATAFTSCGMSRSRNLSIFSSSRRMALAIFAVSLSPTAVASASIAV